MLVQFIGKSKNFSIINLDLESCLYGLLTVFSFATVNLSDFSSSALILLINSLEAMSLLGILIVLWGHAVRVIAAVVHFKLEFEFLSFDLGGLLHFLLTCVVSIDFVL